MRRPAGKPASIVPDRRIVFVYDMPLDGEHASVSVTTVELEPENPAFTGSPTIEITRMVEESDVVMAEMTAEVRRASGELMRTAMGEVFVMRDAKICERRAYVVELKENDYM